MLSGCITGGQNSSPTPAATGVPPWPGTTPTTGPGGSNPAGADNLPAATPVPTATPVPQWPPGTPGAPDSPGNPSPAIPTPAPTPVGSPTPVPTVTPTPTQSASPTATPSPSPSVTPQPALGGRTSGWGTDKSTYNRGDTVTGWVDVTNTGTVPITEVDITLVLARTDFPVSKTDNYKSQGLNVQPGQTQRITFSETIPPTYGGISTAGNYRLTASAYLAGNNIGSFTKYITIV